MACYMYAKGRKGIYKKSYKKRKATKSRSNNSWLNKVRAIKNMLR